MSTDRIEERFSGHESFVCRFGWLVKVFRAVRGNGAILRNEEMAMSELGIGRNMVKSIQFWGEASGTISAAEDGGHVEGPVGRRLMGLDGWDPHLESLESLWVLHWWLSTRAGLAAWNTVFADSGMTRFERRHLVEALAARGAKNARSLAPSTLEQHASIFLQTYYQAERGSDDTSWCPLQDLGLITGGIADESRTVYVAGSRPPLGLTLRAFAAILLDYFRRRLDGQKTVSFQQLAKAPFSPGCVLRLEEGQLRAFLEAAEAGPLRGAIRFLDTADTQSVVLVPAKFDPDYQLQTDAEELVNA